MADGAGTSLRRRSRPQSSPGSGPGKKMAVIGVALAVLIAGAVSGILLTRPHTPAQLMAGLSSIVGFHLPLSVLLVGLPVVLLSGASLVGNDPRPSIAAAIYAVVNLGALVAAALAFGVVAPTLLIVLLTVMVTTLATGALSGRRLARTDF